MACCNAMAKLASAALRFPLASHPRDVVADFIVACVVAHAPSSFSQRPIIGHAILGSIDVCFTPESGHVQCKTPCPLWAKSGHGAFPSAGLNLQPYCRGRCKPSAGGECP